MYQAQFPADGIQLLNKPKKKKKKQCCFHAAYILMGWHRQKTINYQVVIDGENKTKGCAPDGTDLYFSCVVN